MDKFTETARLLDLYGALLTDRQRDVLDLYFNYDLSLQEIAENQGISRQGVHDLIKRGEHALRSAEEKLGFLARLDAIAGSLQEIYIGLEKTATPPNQDRRLDMAREKVKELLTGLTGG